MIHPTVEPDSQEHPPPPQNLTTEPQIHHVQPPPPQNPYVEPQGQYAQRPPPQNLHAERRIQFEQQPPYKIAHSEPQVQYVQSPPQNNTYVQPPPQFHPQQGGHDAGPVQWSSDLLACTEDPCNCFLTLFFPCITFGRIAEIVNEGSMPCAVSGGIYGLLCLTGYAFAFFHGGLCLTGFAWCSAHKYRTEMRTKYNLAKSPCDDCLVHCCCDLCALCQEYKELKHRGYDPALGWKGNQQNKQNGIGTATVPPLNQAMVK